MEITIHTGSQGDRNKINIEWFDENNVKKSSILEVKISDKDKPRTLEIILNKVTVGTIR